MASFSVNFLFLSWLLYIIQDVYSNHADDYIWDCPSNTSVCLSGGKHKTIASPEDSSYGACYDYQNLSCCTSNFTQQLAQSDVTHIQDGDTIFNWTHCGSISETCEAYLIEIECFYRCSPLMIYFAGDYPSSLDYVPMCSSFCDWWYDACKDDLTCVDNWVFDWEYDSETGENICPSNSTCQTFETWYKNSTQLCNVLWGNSFQYTDDSDSDNYCLTPGDYDNNVDAVDAIFDVVCETHEPTSMPTAMPGSSNSDDSDSDEYIWDCPSNTSVCLSGGKHKTVASPEDDTYAACLDYQDLSCCTSNFTQQLATSDVTHIQDGDTIFNWTHCGAISESCEAYLIEIECFYRCSPLMIYFAGDYPSSLDYVPMCSTFCDSWYDACKDDLTCVDNWIFDWEYDSETGENVCPDDSTCQTFETWYKNSTQLCNVLWGNSFEYTDDSDNSNYCLTPGDYDNNVDAVDAIFDVVCGTEDEGNDDNESNESDDGTVVIVVVIAVTVILVAIIVVIVMKKNSQKPTVGYDDNGATTR